ncbi:MAG: hypothetical protein JXA54_00250 [Candidatus Heimdallarchaeota archaeon]|nr:hypothetical protein [Candidatus Heimdallarchaeota archaeon]
MLTKEMLKNMLVELLSLNELGCTFDFKDRFGVSLSTLEVLGLVKVIKSKIPVCGDHCTKYNDCQWITNFESKKSSSKYKLTKEGLELATTILAKTIDDKLAQDYIIETISQVQLIDVMRSLLLTSKEISIEYLVLVLLEQTTLSIDSIRKNAKDILNLMESLQLLQLKEGKITPIV